MPGLRRLPMRPTDGVKQVSISSTMTHGRETTTMSMSMTTSFTQRQGTSRSASSWGPRPGRMTRTRLSVVPQSQTTSFTGPTLVMRLSCLRQLSSQCCAIQSTTTPNLPVSMVPRVRQRLRMANRPRSSSTAAQLVEPSRTTLSTARSNTVSRQVDRRVQTPRPKIVGWGQG